MVKRIMVLLLCVVFLMAQPFDLAFGAQKQTAELTEMKGSVQVIRGGGEKPFDAFVNMKLSEGDRIITGPKSSAKIRIDKDTLITLSENTKINISELKGSKGAKQSSIKLQAGGVGAFIKKLLKGGSRFEIKTPTAVMGVRGTEFFTGYSNGKNDVRVLSGTVGISPAGTGSGGGTTQLTSMQQATFGAGATADDIGGSAEPLGLAGLPLDFLEQLQRMNDENPGSVPDELMDGLDEALERAARESEERGNRGDFAPDGMPDGPGASIVGQRTEGSPGTTARPSRPQRPSRPGSGSTNNPPQDELETGQVEPVDIAFEVVEFTTSGAIGGHALEITLTTETEDATIHYVITGVGVEVGQGDAWNSFLVYFVEDESRLVGATQPTNGGTSDTKNEITPEVITVKAYATKEGMDKSEPTEKKIWFDGEYAVEDFEVEWIYEHIITGSSRLSLEVGLEDYELEAFVSRDEENKISFQESIIAGLFKKKVLIFAADALRYIDSFWLKITPDPKKPREAKWIEIELPRPE